MVAQLLSLHVLQHLATAQRAGVPLGLEELVATLAVRRADVRASLGRLHAEGLLDVSRMRLTLVGFAVGSALLGRSLPALRVERGSRVAAA